MCFQCTHKKNDKQCIKNYRPVSLLPICSKIFERFLFNELYELFNENDLSSNQSGFRPGDLCINQLLSITHEKYQRLKLCGPFFDPVTEVLNLPPDDEVEICSKISLSNDLDSQPSQLSSSDITPIVNAATTPVLNTAITPKHHSYDTETLVKSVEDKLLSKIAALQSHFFNDIFDLRKDITLLKENNEKGQPANLNDKKDEVISLKKKSSFLNQKIAF